jgi:hypothetical protein
MKWKKHGRNSRRANHLEFWDLLSNGGALLAFIRMDTRADPPAIYTYANDTNDHELQRRFDSVREAKDYTVAYFVNKRLEEA